MKPFPRPKILHKALSKKLLTDESDGDILSLQLIC